MQVTACTGFSIATSTEGTPKAATKIDFFCGVNNRHAGRLVGTAQAHQIGRFAHNYSARPSVGDVQRTHPNHIAFRTNQALIHLSKAVPQRARINAAQSAPRSGHLGLPTGAAE
jgi:hypothetical protein